FSIRTSPASCMTVARMGALKHGPLRGDRPSRSRYRQALSAKPARRYPRVVDARKEMREFLTTRRARLTPDQAGLRTYGGTRRVPGLRREEVALLAGVSVDYYTRLERGNAGGVSETVLESLARALRLDDVERMHLFDLARATQPPNGAHRRPASQRVRSSVQLMLDAMTEAPAFLRNGRLDILAANPLGRALYAPHFTGP